MTTGDSNRIVVSGALPDGTDELVLEDIRKLVVNPVLIPDDMVGADKKRRYLTGIEIRRIEWWDKTKATETSPLAVYGNPRDIIRQLVRYRRAHRFKPLLSELDRKEIQITTTREERNRESEQQNKALRWFFKDYLPSIDSTAAEAKKLASAAKPTRHYIVETLVVAVVCTLIGLFMGENPSRAGFLLPVEVAAVFAIIRYYGEIESWVRRLFRSKKASERPKTGKK